MSFKIDIEIKDRGAAEIKAQLKKMNNSYTAVGYFGGSGDPSKDYASRAALLEHGAEIQVTKKMRFWWLHNMGVMLKKTVIKIPKRAFMKQTFSKNVKAIGPFLEKEYENIISKKYSVQQALSRVGAWYTGKIKEEMTSGNFTPNAPVTIARKGSSKPLINEGLLRASTTHREVMK